MVVQEEPREEEASRQKEFLEKVVVSQKSQLQQLEKLQKLNCVKMMRDNKVRSQPFLAPFKFAGSAERNRNSEERNGGYKEVQSKATQYQE